MAFKDLYSGNDVQTRDSYIAHRHNSESMPTVIQMIRTLKQKKSTMHVDEETFDQNMSILLSILEPLLINDYNLETCFKLGMAKDLCDLMNDQPLPSENQGGKPFR